MGTTSIDESTRTIPPVVEKKRRVSPRIDIAIMVAYVMVDRRKRSLGKGLAKVVNLSRGGLKMQTRKPIKTPFHLLSLPVEGEKQLAVLVEMCHCQNIGKEIILGGFKFLDENDYVKRFIIHLVKADAMRKNLTEKSYGFRPFRPKVYFFETGGYILFK
jgi:hypothetical protein